MPPRMPGMGVGTGDMMPGGFVAPGGMAYERASHEPLHLSGY